MEKIPRVEYKSPKEVIEEDDEPQHHFDLVANGEKIGGAEIDYFSKPLPLYQMTDLYVDFEHNGNHYASQIMGQVEEWLIKRKKPGVLVDAVFSNDSAKGMYEKRGWERVPDSNGLMVFNWPKDVPLSVLKGYPWRYTDMKQRLEKRV